MTSYRRTFVPLGSSSYGGSRFGSTSIGNSYISPVSRDRSSSKDGYGSDYKSGYSSGAGSTPYSSRFSTSNIGEQNKSIPSLASKFGDASVKTRNQQNSSNVSALSNSSPSYARTRSRDLSNSINDIKDNKIGRTRTTDLPISSVNAKISTGVVKDTIKPTDTNKSDIKPSLGSSYSPTYSSKLNWNRNSSYLKEPDPSYRRPYSRENSQSGSDAGGMSGWRSKVYGNENSSPARPTTLSIPNDLSSKERESPTILKRPSAFQIKPKTPQDEDPTKNPNLPSPNAVKVLPTFPKATAQDKSRAPADFTSCSELSEDERGKENLSRSIQPQNNEYKRARPFRHLNAVPELQIRKPLQSQGFAQPPTVRLSDKLSTDKHELMKTGPTPSKWLKEKEEGQKQESSQKATDSLKPTPVSVLPPRSPPLGGSRSPSRTFDKKEELSIANKEYRKSVLNMNVEPEQQEFVKRVQEDKRDEMTKIKQKGNENASPLLSKKLIPDSMEKTSTYTNDVSCLPEESELSTSSSSSSSSSSNKIPEDKPPVPKLEISLSKSRLVERKHSKGKGDLRKSGSKHRFRERHSSHSKTSSTSSSSESEDESVRVRNSSFNKLPKSKNNSRDIIDTNKSFYQTGKDRNNFKVENEKSESKYEVITSHNIRNRNKKETKDSDDSESEQEGCFFKLTNCQTLKQVKPTQSKLSFTPTVLISVDGLGDRTSPDGKEKDSTSNSIADLSSALKEFDKQEAELSFTYNLCLPSKTKNDTGNGSFDTGLNECTVSASLTQKDSTVPNGYCEFSWPDGSPKFKRKQNYFRTQWDTETETEMEGWSDSSIPMPKQKMSKLPEEVEDELGFEWPSSPEMWKKKSCGYDTEGQAFDWPSSPELKIRNDPKFIGFTTDIDSILVDVGAEDNFSQMEKMLGVPITPEDEISAPELTNANEELTESRTLEEAQEKETEAKTESESGEPDENEDSSDKPETSLRQKARKNLSVFLGKFTNIDEILGNVLQPLTFSSKKKEEEKSSEVSSETDEGSIIQEIHASEVKVHDGQALMADITTVPDCDETKASKLDALREEIIKAVKDGLDDATLQVYRDGDYGNYLDLEATLAEQADDIDGLTESKKNALILRTQLSVRVHAIIEKLQSSEGRELRRALFSLKQIFQDDKDLVHAFVQHDGLNCLIKVGSSADHTYQTYILRAIGQVMLYVDGMTGISGNQETIQWLYSLVSSKSRLVVKTALKLLLVFVEYSEGNSSVLIKALTQVDKSNGRKAWSSLIDILEGKECPDTELMIYAMTLINKTLNGVPDQDTYYDQSDRLEEQGLETLIQKHMHNPNSDLDLLQQLTIYEAVLAYEDGDDVCRTRTIDPSIRTQPRFSTVDREDSNRRRSKRHCITPPLDKDDAMTSSDDEKQTLHGDLPIDDLGGIKHAEAGVTPALRRRRERAERQRTFLNDQESRRGSQSPDSGVEEENRKNRELSGVDPQSAKMIEILCGKREGDVKDIASRIATLLDKENVENNRRLPIELTMDTSVKDILKKLSTGSSLTSAEQEKLNRLGDVSGRIQRAKEGLALAQMKSEEAPAVKEPPKKSENDIQWENLVKHINRPLVLGDMDFTDLNEDDVEAQTAVVVENGVPVPPPPPPSGSIPPPPPNPLQNGNGVPPPPPNPLLNGKSVPPPPPNPLLNGVVNGTDESHKDLYNGPIPPPPGFNLTNGIPQKSKKTIKLFWKEIRDKSSKNDNGTIWDALDSIKLDTQRLEFLFESRAKDLNTKKQQDLKGMKEVIVLDPKRSNVINIGMTKLPPPRTIKTAILKMDSSIINREGIEKLLLTMLPSEEEKQKIQEAAVANPELPLGSAEQFLMMLSSISELPARLKLWLFKLDYENLEKEVADPLMDLKEGIADLQKNKTFKTILSILLFIGNFLNGTDAKGFHIEYLSKVPEVKDTVNKHSLLHHLCQFVLEKFPDTSDLYSDIGAITRASRVDFDELQNTIERLEIDCKSSWDHLKAIAKHDGPTQMKLKMSEFLADCAERIIVLGIIHKKIMKRFTQFLTWMGLSQSAILDAKVQRICMVMSEFALEYRTCRERVIQQLQKKANHRERNKTRGKMITETEKFKGSRHRSKEEEADNDLRQLLNNSDISDNEAIRGNTWRRRRESKTRSREEEAMMEALADGLDDALIDSLVKTATQTPSTRSTPRERKRSRHSDRKSSIKRSRTRDRSIIAELQTLQAVSEAKD